MRLQILLKAVLSLGLFYCAYLVGVRAVANWHFRSQPAPIGIRAAMQWTPGNPEYYAALARSLQRSVGEGNPEEIVELYEKATQLGPSRARYWVELGDAYELSGREEPAQRAYEQAQQLFPESPDINWRLGNFYVRTGRIGEALPALQKAMLGNPRMRLPAFDLAWRAGADPEQILRALLPPQEGIFFQYLNYLLRAGRLDEAGQAWDRLLALGLRFEPLAAYPYLDALIREQRVDEMEQVWEALLERGPGGIPQTFYDQSRITNGDFEGEILNGGLGWRVRPVEGAAITVDNLTFFDGTQSLRIRFDGKHNLDYNHVFQYVPVKPNTLYHFLGYMRVEGITTDSGPRFEIQDYYDRSRLFLATEDVRGTSSWSPLRLEFRTGAATRLLILRVARRPSRRFDNQLSGTVWIDRLSLLPVGVNSRTLPYNPTG